MACGRQETGKARVPCTSVWRSGSCRHVRGRSRKRAGARAAGRRHSVQRAVTRTGYAGPRQAMTNSEQRVRSYPSRSQEIPDTPPRKMANRSRCGRARALPGAGMRWPGRSGFGHAARPRRRDCLWRSCRRLRSGRRRCDSACVADSPYDGTVIVIESCREGRPSLQARSGPSSPRRTSHRRGTVPRCPDYRPDLAEWRTECPRDCTTTP